VAKIEHDQHENMLHSLRAKVFIQLHNDILNGKYQNGDSLIETRLSDEMGVSRTPIREAIRQLELEGLVQLIPNKGAVVIGISKKDIEDIYKIRVLLEGLAARWAAVNIKPLELAELKDALDLEEFYTSKNDVEHILKLDSDFHEVIYKASKSTPLMHTLRNFHQHIQKSRNLSLSSIERAKEAFEEHRAIYKAIEDKDEEKAEKLATLHVIKAAKNIIKD
jgi:DNA-binding GntR family transcriptional regulator